jgi:plastocyanin
LLARSCRTAAALLLVAAASCSASPTSVVEVRIVARPEDAARPFVFEPAMLHVSAGATIRWVNDTDAYHTVTFTNSLDARQPNGSFDRQAFMRGDRVERTLAAPGTYFFYCQPHAAFMFGTVTVR